MGLKKFLYKKHLPTTKAWTTLALNSKKAMRVWHPSPNIRKRKESVATSNMSENKNYLDLDLVFHDKLFINYLL